MITSHSGGIEFRRNDQDRAPAKPMVRPNDGPGDWSTRRALAKEALLRAHRGRVVMNKPKSAAELRLEALALAQTTILAALAAARYGMEQSAACDLSGISQCSTEKLVKELEAQGLVERTGTARRGGGRYIVLAITDAGRDELAAG